MHIQLFTCVLLILYMKERKQQGEKREKQEQICRINEQVDRTAPQLCVIYDIWKEEKSPHLAPHPPKHGVTKRSSFHGGERKRCTNRKTREGELWGHQGDLQVTVGLGRPLQSSAQRRRASKAHPSSRELTDRRHVRSDVQRKDSLIRSYTQDWVKILSAGKGMAFSKCSLSDL